MCYQRTEYDADLRENFRELDRLYGENAQMKARTEQLADENQQLEDGLKEVGYHGNSSILEFIVHAAQILTQTGS